MEIASRFKCIICLKKKWIKIIFLNNLPMLESIHIINLFESKQKMSAPIKLYVSPKLQILQF